ncbi:hypothetical protein X759_33370 [Mesorhizobium sp. LSHC420B00]|nr:hypothetical protein X759_33370 [Mesorhizobium sp. LSHC420B00]
MIREKPGRWLVLMREPRRMGSMPRLRTVLIEMMVEAADFPADSFDRSRRLRR